MNIGNTDYMESDELDFPPFPPMKWDTESWTAPIVLLAWSGFEYFPLTYDNELPDSANGQIILEVFTPIDERNLPSIEQVAAYNYLFDHQIEVQRAILDEAFKDYQEQRISVAQHIKEGLELIMPVLAEPDDMRKVMGLIRVMINSVSKDGIAYVGFEFECTFDVEHNAGVMTHRNRVVEIGLGESAYYAAEFKKVKNK